MSEIKWIKITTDIFDDEKMKLIDSLPESDALIVIWFKLLTLAGKVNDSGSIYISKKMPITDEMLSTIFNRQLNTVRLALNTFVKFGMITIEDHINITNWEKHQNVDKMAKIKEQNAERQRRHRERMKELPEPTEKSNVTVTSRNALDKSREDKISTTTTIDVDMSEIMQTYSDNIHPVSGQIEVDRLLELLTRFGKTWVITAIDRAVVRNKRSLGYIEGILKGWDTNGFDDGEVSKNGQRPAANCKPNYAKGKKPETDWSNDHNGWD